MTQRLTAEAAGTGLLLFVIVGSGIAADNLTSDSAVILFTHAIAVGAGLAVLIALFQTISGSHFNPAVTLAFWRSRQMEGRAAGQYMVAQVAGGLVGVVVAHLSFGEDLLAISATSRSDWGLLVSEFVGTLVLVLVILVLVRTDRPSAIPAAVGAWVAVIVFASSSTGFANPAVTIARMFTDTFTGIAPESVPGFLLAQLLAGLVAVIASNSLLPTSPAVQA